jgi:hypothetical protein
VFSEAGEVVALHFAGPYPDEWTMADIQRALQRGDVFRNKAMAIAALLAAAQPFMPATPPPPPPGTPTTSAPRAAELAEDSDSMTRTATVLVGCWLAGALPATAQSRILIAESDRRPAGSSSAQRPPRARKAEMLAAACAAEDGHSPREVQNALSCAKPKSSLRWEASRDARLDVFVVYPRREAADPLYRTVAQDSHLDRHRDVDEARRQTHRRPRGRRRATLMLGTEPMSSSASAPTWLSRFEQPKRAASTGGSNEVVRLEGGGAAAAKAGSTEDSTATASATLVTGPAEHWFLSADLPFRRSTS